MKQNAQNSNLVITSEFITKRGSFASVEAPLTAMRCYEDTDYDYFINLTGECYPIMHPDLIKQDLKGQALGFMEFFELPSNVWHKGGMDRLHNKFYFISFGKHYKIITVPRLRKEMPCGLKPYGGSAAFCLHKEHISYILNSLDKNPNIIRFFKHAGYSDEVFFQTILMNSSFKSQIINDDRRYIDWNRSVGGHPKYLTGTDFEKIMSSNKFFARKFSVRQDPDILNMIDEKLDRETA